MKRKKRCIIRPHRLHAVPQMSHVAWSACLCIVCVLGTRVSCGAVQKQLNQSRCRLVTDSRGSKEPCVRGRGRRDGDKTAMRPLPNYFGHLLCSLQNIGQIENGRIGQCKSTASSTMVDSTDQWRQRPRAVLAQRWEDQVQNTVETCGKQRLGPVVRSDF